MSLTTYSGLKAAVADWLNRTDMTTQIVDAVTLFEAACNKALRSTHMVTDATVTASTRRTAVPTDLIEPLYIQETGDTTSPLEQVSPEQIVQMRRRFLTTGTPRVFAMIGRYVEMAPAPAASTIFDVVYYREIPALSDTNTSNWLLEHHPELYLYGTLVQCAIFIKDNARLQLYSTMVAENVRNSLLRNELTVMDGVKVPGYFLNPTTEGAAALQQPRTL